MVGHAPMLQITANLALSADGKISTRGRHGSGFGSAADHDRLLELRAAADAVLVGRATLEADSMTLGLGDRADLSAARVARGKSPYPARLIACGSRRPSPDHPVFHGEGGSIHLLDGHAIAAEVRRLAAAMGWTSIHCEGGARLLAALLAAGLVDRLFLTICPWLFGGHSAPMLLPKDVHWLASQAWRMESCDSTGEEIFLCYRR